MLEVLRMARSVSRKGTKYAKKGKGGWGMGFVGWMEEVFLDVKVLGGMIVDDLRKIIYK
jgi:hypothetical protein